MDPEIVERLNEQLREMYEILSEQNAMMAAQMKSMKDLTAASDKSTTASAKATKATKELTESTEELTKKEEAYARAEKERQEAVQEATDRINKAMGTVANGFLSLGSVIMDSTHSFSKYNGMIGSAGDAALDLGKNFGILGTVIGGVVKAATMLMQYQLAQADSLLKFNDQISKMGAANAFNTDEILSMANKIGFAAKDLDKLMAPMQKLGSTFKQLGNGAVDSTNRFMEMANVGSEVRQEFQRLGYSQAELVEAQAGYVELMGGAGLSLRSFNGEMKTLQKTSLAYVKNLQALSDMTGLSVEDQTKRMAAAAADTQFQLYVADMNKKIASASTEEEKQKLAAQVELAMATKAQITALQGEEAGRGYGQALAGAPITEGLGTMAVSGTLGTIQELARETRAGNINSAKDAAKYTQAITDSSAKAQDQLKIAAAISPDAANLVGGTGGITERNRLFGLDQEKAAADIQKRIDDNAAGKGKAAEDSRQQARNILTETEIALRTAFDSFAGNLGIASTALIALAGAAGLAALAIAARGGLARLAGGAAAGGARAAGAGAAGAGAAGAGAAGAGAAGAGGAAAAGKGAQLLKAAKGAAIVAGGAYVIDAGFGAAGVGKDLDSKTIQSQDDKNWERASTWEKTQSSLARGIEHIGRFMFMDNLANQAQADRVKSETEYLDKKLSAVKPESKDAAKASAATADGKFADAFGKHVEKFGEIVNKLGSPNKGMSSSVATSFGKNIESFGKLIIAFAKTVTAFAKTVQAFATITGTFAKAVKMFADQNKSINAMGSINSKVKGKSSGLLGTPMEDDNELDVVDYIERLKTSLADAALSTDSLREAEMKRHRFTEESMMQFRRSLTDASKILNKIAGVDEEDEDASTDGSSPSSSPSSSPDSSPGSSNYADSDSTSTSGSATKVTGGGAGYTNLQYEDGREEKRTGTLAWRNNNPGNIRAGDFARSQGAVGQSGGFAVFSSYEQGRKAKEELLFNTSKYKNKTIAGAISKYAPPNENDTRGYINTIVKALGVNSNTPLRDLTPEQRTAMLNAMEKIEGFKAGKVEVLKEGKNAGQGGGSKDIVALGQRLQDQGIRVAEHPAFGGVAPVHKGRGHYEGRAIDINIGRGVNESKDPKARAKFDQIADSARSDGFKVIWKAPGHYSHMHIESPKKSSLQARKGGLVKGPDSGYPVEMHGSEMITPLTQDSVLAKLAKTPAETPEISNAISSTAPTMEKEILERVVNMNAELVEGMLSKLGDMVSAISDGNDTREKILKNSMV